MFESICAVFFFGVLIWWFVLCPISGKGVFGEDLPDNTTFRAEDRGHDGDGQA